MTLRHRPMQAADIDPCVEIVASHPVIGPRYGDAIEDLRLSWFRLIEYGTKTTAVFEEVDGAAFRLLGSGISVFVSDEFMHVVKTPPFFWIGAELARRIARGTSPLLSNKQLREANSCGGLNLLSWEGCLGPEDMKRPDVYNKVMSVFIENHRGYLWKEIVATQADTVERRTIAQYAQKRRDVAEPPKWRVGGRLSGGAARDHQAAACHWPDARDRNAPPWLVGRDVV